MTFALSGNVDTSTLGVSVVGNLVAERLQVASSTDEVSSHFYVYDSSLLASVEACRETFTVSGTDSTLAIGVRLSDNIGTTLETTLVSTAAETTVATTDADRNVTAVVFSADGISFTSESVGGVYFGAEKDFRIVITDTDVGEGEEPSMAIQAFSSTLSDYQTKYTIGSS